ncbi:MAG TPA: tetratricopeptide repeat protein [Polyangiaceae bacterium]
MVAVAAYARTIGFGFTGLDDRDLVVDDQGFLAQPSSLWRVFAPGRAYMHVVDAAHGYWRPLVTWTYALDAMLGGARPLAYHATNVALHAAACVVLWRLLLAFDLGPGPALAGALVFAVHPALASAVAWVPGRNDALLGLLVFGAWLAFARRRSAAHFACFALALLTKETAVALPLACALHALLVDRTLARARWLGLHALGWTALVALRLLAHRPADVRPTLANLPLLLDGLGKIGLPVHLSPISDAADASPWAGVVVALAIAAASLLVRGVRRPVVLLGVATFVLFLLPPLLATGSLVIDERLYVPAAGIVLAVGEIARALAPERRAFAAFAGVAVGVLAIVTLAFEGSFRDRRSFARDAVDGAPHSGLAHFCLGQSEQLDGHDDRALAEYAAALELGSTEVVHNDIAVIEMKRARWPEAERELRAEIAVNPDFATAWSNLAIVLRHEGRSREADEAEQRALDLGR